MAFALAAMTQEIEVATSGMRRLFPDILSRDRLIETAIREALSAERSAPAVPEATLGADRQQHMGPANDLGENIIQNLHA
jgi:hypothetical protein